MPESNWRYRRRAIARRVLLCRSRLREDLHTGRHIQHSRHAVSARNALGNEENGVRQLDKLHQNLRHVIDQRDHLSLRERPRVHGRTALPDDKHDCQIDQHIGQRIHECGQPACLVLQGGLLAVHLPEFFNLLLLLAESTDNPHAAEVFAGCGGHAVQLALHAAVQRNAAQHNPEHHQRKKRYGGGKDQCQMRINGERHDHGTEHDDGRTQCQPQRHVDTGLDLVDVAGHARDHGSGSDAIRLGIGERLHMRKQIVSQVGRGAHRRFG